MASYSEDRLKEALTCGLCKEILSDPRTLPCLHPYCVKCLHSLVEKAGLKGGSFNCPECRHECYVPQQGVDEFRVSPTITFLLDAYKDENEAQKPECTTCRDTHESHTPATTKCLECNKKLCVTCRKLHDSFLQGHKVLDLTGDKAKDLETALQNIKERTVYCKVHPTKPLELYCKEDKTVLCQLCYTINHCNHDAEEVKDAAAKNMKPIGAVISQVKGHINIYEQGIQDVHAYKGKLEKNADDITAKINNDRNNLTQVIHKRYKSFTDQVLKEKESNIKQAMAHLGHLELQKAIMEGQVNKFCTMVQHGHPVEIAGLIEQVKKKSEEWLTKPQVDFDAKICLEFTEAQSQNDTVKFGKVQIKREPKITPLCEPRIEHTNDLASDGLQDIIVTPDGDYVTTSARDTSKIFDKNKKLKKDMLIKFKNVTLTNDGNLAFTDGSNTIRIYSQDGSPVVDIKCNKTVKLWGIVMNSNGELVVSDNEAKIIYHIDPLTGNITAQSKPGTFVDPWYVTCNSKDVVIVSDWKGHKIIGIDRNGQELFSYGEGSSGEGELFYPRAVCTDQTDNIFIGNNRNKRVQHLNHEGRYIRCVMKFKNFINGVAIDNSGQLIVGDYTGKIYTVKYRE